MRTRYQKHLKNLKMQRVKRAEMFKGQLQDIKNRIIEKIKEGILILTDGVTDETVELRRAVLLRVNDSDGNLNRIIKRVSADNAYISDVFSSGGTEFQFIDHDSLISLLESIEHELDYIL